MSASGWLQTSAMLTRLAAGEVVLLATDTVPGLHARLDRPEGLRALTALKGRDDEKPLLVLADSAPGARKLAGTLPAAVAAYLEACWPGPYTFVLPAGVGLPRQVVGPSRTVAVRVPAWPELRALLARSGPLASSSANRSGEPAAPDLAAAARSFPQLAVWSALPEDPEPSASAIVDLLGERPRLLRPGPRPLPPWPAGV